MATLVNLEAVKVQAIQVMIAIYIFENFHTYLPMLLKNKNHLRKTVAVAVAIGCYFFLSKDIDSLYEAKLSGLSKPHLFVQQLQSGRLRLKSSFKYLFSLPLSLIECWILSKLGTGVFFPISFKFLTTYIHTLLQTDRFQ